jgi:hypothetical protein
MRASTIKDAVGMVATLGDKDLMNDAKEARKINPVEDMRLSVFEFFKDTIAKIGRMELIQAKAQEALNRRLDQDEQTPLPLDDLMRIYNNTSEELRRARESIISLFRPVPGAPSLLANSVGDKPPEGGEARYDQLSAEDRQAVEALRLLIEERMSSSNPRSV